MQSSRTPAIGVYFVIGRIPHLSRSPSGNTRSGGVLGDFFGPGTTVGNPFATQAGARLTF
jgi:hypothetical protein